MQSGCSSSLHVVHLTHPKSISKVLICCLQHLCCLHINDKFCYNDHEQTLRKLLLFYQCSFEGRKDLQTMEVEASPSPLVFTEVSGIAAIVTDKAERDGNSSEERRNHTARPWTPMAAPPKVKTQSTPGTLQEVLYQGESEDGSVAKPIVTGGNGCCMCLNGFMSQLTVADIVGKKSSGSMVPNKI